ncbi:MAG TPA: LCP family protein [Anaerolineales bacterium]|nr:LCP family protein [Anaerolineales bacterium]
MDKYDSYLDPAPEPTQPITSRDLAGKTQPSIPQKKRGRPLGCSRLVIWVFVLLLAYAFAPFRSNVLILGIDRTPEGSDVGRSDTIILLGLQPFTGQANLLSIPRDLWVPIPGYGEHRINAAHAFGEGALRGSGPQLALATVRSNFGVGVSHYLRIRLEGFAAVIDALGGVEITLERAAAGYPAGTHGLNGEQALAFVRDRTGDDFFRMQHGQLFIIAVIKKMLNPLSWLRVPGAMLALVQAVDTNIPVWDWPRLSIALLRAVLFDGINAVTIPREAVTPWVTNAGAQVLLPNWDLILPIVRELFGLF